MLTQEHRHVKESGDHKYPSSGAHSIRNKAYITFVYESVRIRHFIRSIFGDASLDGNPLSRLAKPGKLEGISAISQRRVKITATKQEKSL